MRYYPEDINNTVFCSATQHSIPLPFKQLYNAEEYRVLALGNLTHWHTQCQEFVTVKISPPLNHSQSNFFVVIFVKKNDNNNNDDFDRAFVKTEGGYTVWNQ